MCRKYKPNNVYILESHGCQYYVGCHTQNQEMYESEILRDSANPLISALRKKLITPEEYKDCCKIVHIEEFDSTVEAKNRETELITKFKERYGSQCLNQSKGNKYGQLGLARSKETKKKIAESLKGKTLSEEHKKKMSESQLNHPKKSKRVLQFDLNGNYVTEYLSVMEASRQTGITRGNISSCLTGRLKSAGKSVWKYA